MRPQIFRVKISTLMSKSVKTFMTSLIILTAFLSLALSVSALANTKTANTKTVNTKTANTKILESEIKFSSVGNPSFIKVNGTVPLVEVNFTIVGDKINGTATVDLNKLDSGIGLRDKHLKEKYLHTKKNPKATILIEKQSVVFSGKNNKIKGTLNFHGKKKEIVLDTKLTRKGNIVSVNSNFEFLLTDFGVELPSFQGITAADKVKLKINTKLEI